MTAPRPPLTFRFGQGEISGALSALLGVLAILAVACFHAPGLLTFPELHRQYDPAVMRLALGGGIVAALVLGLVNFLIGRWRALGYVGMGAATVAVLLGGAAATRWTDATTPVSLGLDWLILDLLASVVLFVPFERLFALRREQAILRDGWRTDLTHFAAVHLLVSLIILCSTGLVFRLTAPLVWPTLRATVGGWPLWVQLPLVLLAADLAQYASHRLMHVVPWLWRVHSVHHSARTMDWLASSRLHLVEVLITRTCVLAPVFLLGFSELAVNLYVVYVGIHAIVVHANTRFTFGPLRHLLVEPAFHHWHHSEDPRAMNKNFAVHYPWIDRLFGTAFAPAEWPVSYGIGPEPMPDSWLAQMAHPFRRRAGQAERAASGS